MVSDLTLSIAEFPYFLIFLNFCEKKSGKSRDFIENQENQEVWEAKIYRTRNSLA